MHHLTCSGILPSFRQPHSVHSPPGPPYPAHHLITSCNELSLPARHQQYTEVRQRLVSSAAWRRLARRHWSGALQVGSTGIPFATWDRSRVPDKWQASSRRRRRSLDVSTCDLLLNRNWSFHGAVGRRLAVGRFRWQVRQSGMHHRTVWEIQSWL